MTSKQAVYETLDWGVFFVGGVIAAFLLPVQIVITLLLHEPVPGALLASPFITSLAKFYLFVVLGGATWHGIHRIRFILYDLGLSHHKRVVTVLVSLMMVGILIWAFVTVFTF